jgi:hypothetical protein
MFHVIILHSFKQPSHILRRIIYIYTQVNCELTKVYVIQGHAFYFHLLGGQIVQYISYTDTRIYTHNSQMNYRKICSI